MLFVALCYVPPLIVAYLASNVTVGVSSILIVGTLIAMLCWENATICRVNVIIHCFLFALSCVGFISLLIYILANDLPKTKCSLAALFEDMMDKEEHWYGEIDFIHSPKECKYYVNLF